MLTPAAFKDLAGLTHLEKLSLFEATIGDAHLKELVAFKQLKDLNLISCFAVTDAGLKELARLKNLEWLAINDISLSRGALLELQNALPHCKIGHPILFKSRSGL